MGSHLNFRWTFAIASLAWFAFALDRLVVTTALPAIRVDVAASPSELEWTVNAYTLTFAVLLLTGAALGDRFGRRRMFTVGVGVFTLGSACAALAPTVGALVAARAVQGAGGAVFAPLTLTMLSAATPPARRGSVLGAWGGIGAIGAAIGPLVGGGLTDTVGWRSVFWLNVPLGAVLVPLARRTLQESHGPHRALDIPGVALGSTGLLGVVWGVVRGAEVGWTTSGELLALAGGLLALAAFVVWERHAPHPMLPMRFFGSRTFTLSSLASFTMYASLFGSLYLVTQLLQTGLGSTPLQAGIRTLPMAVMPMVFAPVGGALSDRVGARPLIIGGLAMVALGCGWLSFVVTPSVPYLRLVPALVLAGAGSAVFFAPIAASTLGAVATHEHGQASGAATAVRELAVVFGVAILGSVFISRGGYSSPADFVAGFRPALGLAAALAAVGALVASALPRARHGPVVTGA